MAHMKNEPRKYASCAVVRRAKAAIEATGAVVTSVRLFPDGAIEFLTGVGANDDAQKSEFDRLEAAGLL
jgi:hypothetical protein